ncbi:MAG TPA: CobQ/CobB/MinD/ParA nucleotide binding domain-containing protein [Chloroflexi bacterium]|nr:CobQ/CobB/MinD/ParA nucleotide binding domain-containing protein [Chloroflexota bacterium]
MERGEKIRILIVDDIRQTRENLQKLLSLEPDMEVVGAAKTGEEGIELARQHRPDIVLMDINLPGIDGITATEMISREVPETQVIMISVQGEADYMRRSMLAGAREFLIKPFSSDELLSAIRRVYELGKARRVTPVVPERPAAKVKEAVPEEKGKIVLVFSPKGGAGTSVIAANLAVALQEVLGLRVALVDFSLQFGGQDVILNLQPRRNVADLVSDNLEVDEEMLAGAMLPHPSGIKVLLAPPRPEMADLITPELAKKILSVAEEAFDCVIIDGGSYVNDLILTIMDMSNLILLITTPELTAIKGVKQFFQIMDALNYEPEKVFLILNKDDRRSGITAKDIQASLKHPIEVVIPNEEGRILFSVNQGVPVLLSRRNSPFSESILEMARKLQERLELALHLEH